MTETTILWFADEKTPDNVSWIRVGTASEQAAEVRRGTLTEAAGQVVGRVVVLVPSIDVLLTSVAIPTRNRQRLLAAVPNVLEDYLAADIDALHFAVGRHGPNGRVGVAVVATEQLNEWLSLLREAGMRPNALIPDVLALPLEPDSWTVCEAGRYGLVRTGTQTGFAGDLDNLPLLLQSALEEAGELRPARLRVFPQDSLLTTGRLEETGIEITASSESALQAIAAEFDEKSALNLLQGDFSHREQIGRMWRPWRATAALLAVFLVFHGVMTVVDYVRLSQQDRQLRAQIEQIYRSTFPDSRVVNPRAQMEQQLTALRNASGSGDSGLLILLAGIGKPLAETAGLELQRLSYRDGQIDLALTIKDLQNLDRLKQQLSAQPGIQVEIQSASARDNQVDARLQIKGRAS